MDHLYIYCGIATWRKKEKMKRGERRIKTLEAFYLGTSFLLILHSLVRLING